jgi:hypothetical protein
MCLPAVLLLAAPLCGVALPAAAAETDTVPAALAVSIDSSHHRVVITAGPFELPDMSAHMDHSMSHDTPVLRFAWPVEGWFRGFDIEVLDSTGAPLPRRLMHHLIMINYDRRQLIYPAAERLWGAGVETGGARLPKTIGVPLDPANSLGLYIAWHNDTGNELTGVRLRMTMDWTPRNQLPRPLDVLPVYFDVNLTVGGANEFDIPPGRSEKAFEFTVPTEGRLLGVSGHMHQYGREVRLEDAENGRVLTRVAALQRPNGSIRRMERHLFGVAGAGLKLKARHRYRVIATYENPTSDTLIKGAMGSLVGIYAPSDLSRWPTVEPSDTTFQRDLRFLARRGTTMRRMSAENASPATADSAHAGHEHHHE